MYNELKYKYMYVLSPDEFHKDICKIEMKSIFEKEIRDDYILSNTYIDPSTSPFIRNTIIIKQINNDIDEIINFLKSSKVKYDKYRVDYIKNDDYDMNYKNRIDACIKIGSSILGDFDLHNPVDKLAISKTKIGWIFGESLDNEYVFLKHKDKPRNFSTALNTMLARALVNIAIGNDKNKKIIDPCCGTGTVLIEGLDLNVDIKGYELNKLVSHMARENLEFFSFNKDIVQNKNMHDIYENVDSIILDIPYGLYTKITLKEQKDILKKCREIGKKLVLVCSEDMELHVNEAGFKVIDFCNVPTRRNFKRYIYVCD